METYHDMVPDSMHEGLTFDDVLLQPARSAILPNEADTRTWLSRNIALNIPIVSSAMDTVTESHLAIALAQQGGIGIVHRNMPADRQAEEVDRVKRSESGMIVDPITIRPDAPISEALDLMRRFRISGVPVTENGKLVSTYPISAGRAQFPTMNGTHIVLDRSSVVQMDSATVGIPVNSPNGYDETVLPHVAIAGGG